MALTSPNVGPRDLGGDYMRKIDAGLTGGRAGPIYTAASLTVPAYAANVDAPADCDAYYAVDATAGAVVITAPLAAATPLGTRIRVAKIDASGNSATFSAPDATLSTGATSQTNTTRGTGHSYVLGNLNGTLTWVVE